MLERLKYIIVLSMLCSMGWAQTLTVEPLNGVKLSDGSRAAYVGKKFSYKIKFVIPGDTLTSISVKMNGSEINGTKGISDWTLDNYEVSADANVKEHKFEVSYTAQKDSVGGKKDVTLNVVAYAAPVKPSRTIAVDGNSASIGEATFKFKMNGAAPTTGDPKGWVYTWKMTDQTDMKGETASWKVSKTQSYTVKLSAKNMINGSTDKDYSSDEFDLGSTTVTVYDLLSGKIDRSNVIKGETINVSTKLNGGQLGKWQNASVKINGSTVTSTLKDNIITFELKADDTTEKYDIAVNAENKPDGMSAAVKLTEIKHTIRAWDKAGSTKNPDENEKELRGNFDPDYTMQIVPIGGCQATDAVNGKCGWEYVWTKDGKDISNNKNNYTIDSKTTENISSKYTVTAVNYIDGVECYSQSYSWNIVLWASPSEPTFENSVNTFYGQNTVLVPELHGGYNNWKFEWFENGNSISTADSLATKVYPSGADGNSYTDKTYSVKATNYWKDGSVWDEFIVPITVIVNPLPGVELVYNPENVYYNETIELTFREFGGIPNQWSRTVKYEDSSTGKTTTHYYSSNFDGTYTIRLWLSEKENKDITFYVNCSNGYGNNRISYPEQKWTVHVWKKAEFASALKAPVNMREGDVLTLSVDSPTGGYAPDSIGKTKVEYIFTYDNGNMSTQADPEYTVSTVITSGKEKYKSTKTYQCIVNVLGPDNQVWDSKTYPGNVTLYRRPQIPASVVVKGNGTSGTYIVNMPSDYTNDVLEQNGYNYAYANSQGSVYVNSPKRYAILGSVDQSTLCVATYWVYEDNSVVYSDFRRYGNDAGSLSCDLSTYNGNGTVSGRADGSETDGIETVETDHDSDNAIYDLNGQRVTSPVKGKLYIMHNRKFIFK